jgi:hypothetical protein
MALDRPLDDGARDAGQERHPPHRGSGADDASERARQAEPRTRAECYEALRAADGSGQTDENHRQSVPGADRQADAGTERQADRGTERQADRGTERQADRGTDTGTGRSGWDAVDAEYAEDRPTPDAIRVTPERVTHILDGDSTGGGHRHGTGKPGNTEFPADWGDDKIIETARSIAQKPDQRPVLQDRNNRWLCIGTRDSVEVSVIVLPDGEVRTAWPKEGSPGVVRNPRKGKS